MELSIIIPVYNEEDNVVSLWQKTAAVFARSDSSFEVIFVDDGSNDATAQRLLGLPTTPSRRLLRHQQNYGQSAAIASGLALAEGKFIATLDGDGQNDPGDLPLMLQKLQQEEVDCVTGVRSQRQDNWRRRFSSRIGNRFRSWIIKDNFHDSACGIRVMLRAATRELPVFNGMHRFIPALLQAQGFKVIEMSVRHHARLYGQAKYGIGNRLWRGLKDCFGVRWYRKRAIPAIRISNKEKA